MGFAVWVQNAGDLLGKEVIFWMYLEDIFRNNVIYFYALFCFFMKTVLVCFMYSVCCVLFGFVGGVFFFQIAHLLLSFCVPGDEVSPTWSY